MWGAPVQNLPFCPLSTTDCAKRQAQFGPQSFIYAKEREYMSEDDAIAIHINNNSTARDHMNDEHRTATVPGPSGFSLSVTAGEFEEREEDEMEPAHLFSPFVDERTTMATMTEREVALLWCPQNEHLWLQDENECSQRSVTSCRTQSALAPMHMCEPGAPIKKNRDKGNFSVETDEFSTGSFRSAVHPHLEFLHGNNHSVSLLCESSIPSRVTLLDEAGESVDLAAYLSHLVVASSPARKRLFSTAPTEDVVDPIVYDDGVAEATKTRLSHRGKRFFDELDFNRDVTVSNSSVLAIAREAQRKCRRVDNSGGEEKNFDDCGSDASDGARCCLCDVGVL